MACVWLAVIDDGERATATAIKDNIAKWPRHPSSLDWTQACSKGYRMSCLSEADPMLPHRQVTLGEGARADMLFIRIWKDKYNPK
jgi:hypothetical protein